MRRKDRKRAFTLIELLVVVAIIALLISILLPSLSRARELSKRLVCQSNIKGIGTSFKIYANDNEENWPTPTFNESAQIQWYPTANFDVGKPPGDGSGDYTKVMPDRDDISGPNATTISTTRCFFMQVRAGDVTPKQYICPSSGDQIDPEQNVDLYYDFSGTKNVSYGYQVPFGPFDTRPSEAMDPRMPVAADEGPYNDQASPGAVPPTNLTTLENLTVQQWKAYNSGNHGGKGTGEGQNILFADGHATFEKTPLAGIDEDNIYTRMYDNASIVGRKAGRHPNNQQPGSYPGYQTWDNTGRSTTDALIFP
jgi:prepilin-type N-terminal cleavage/methylation domain-containing protein/prepilin-type processing-associated H-X9-DG protein